MPSGRPMKVPPGPRQFMGCTVEPRVVKHMDDFAIELSTERDEYVTRNDAMRIVLKRWCDERDNAAASERLDARSNHGKSQPSKATATKRA